MADRIGAASVVLAALSKCFPPRYHRKLHLETVCSPVVRRDVNASEQPSDGVVWRRPNRVGFEERPAEG